ncbi:hypothetical protein [Gemmatimonas sp.]|uniref:hypothetical protein n=1 Tax=Gemmatimonas sp. TaxID=1962908 RepID=UPI0039836BCA
MYWILVIMAAIAASLIALVVGGLVTPAHYRVVRRIRLQRGAHDVRTLLADLTAYEQWMPSPTTIERTSSTNVNADTDPNVIALDLTDDDTKAQLQWEWDVTADAVSRPARCTVTLTELGRVGNPVIRFFAALRGHGGNAERTLRALAEHFDAFGVSVERVEK